MPFVEPTVADTGTNNQTDNHPHKQFVGPFRRAILVLIQFDLDQIAQINANCPQQTIPTDTTVTYMEEYRIHIPYHG
jgi:hypothetical protein